MAAAEVGSKRVFLREPPSPFLLHQCELLDSAGKVVKYKNRCVVKSVGYDVLKMESELPPLVSCARNRRLECVEQFERVHTPRPYRNYFAFHLYEHVQILIAVTGWSKCESGRNDTF